MKSLCKTKAKEELTEEQRSHVNKTIEGIMKAPLAIFLSLVQAFIGPSFELLTCKIQNSRVLAKSKVFSLDPNIRMTSKKKCFLGSSCTFSMQVFRGKRKA